MGNVDHPSLLNTLWAAAWCLPGGSNKDPWSSGEELEQRVLHQGSALPTQLAAVSSVVPEKPGTAAPQWVKTAGHLLVYKGFSCPLFPLLLIAALEAAAAHAALWPLAFCREWWSDLGEVHDLLRSHLSVNQTEKGKYHMISLICGILKTDANELIYKIEVDSQTQKTNLWLPKGKGAGEG